MTGPAGSRQCPQCGTALIGASSVEELCAACLLSLALSQDAIPTEAISDPARATAGRGARPGTRPRTLSPIGTGVVAPAWAMPAELLRQAARRLRLAAVGVALGFAVSIVVNNLIEASGWHVFSHLAFRNVIFAAMVGVSAAVVWLTHSGRLGPTRLLRVSLGFEVAVALAISLSDHLEPLYADVSLASISWLCVWIASFPLVVPASPRWALAAGLASASTWPLAYLVGQALGNPAVPVLVLFLTSLEGYIAAGLAMFSTTVIRRLQELGCVAYWLLTGERVFVGRTSVEVLMHHIKTPPVPPSERTGRPIPASLEALVLACLAKDPDERPASAEWLAARLAECETAGDWTPGRAHEWWDTVRAGAKAAAPRADPARSAITPSAP
jgi:hypothetical protein